RLRAGAHAAPTLAGARRARPVGPAPAGGGAAARAGALRGGMARSAAHLLPPRLRHPRRERATDLLTLAPPGGRAPREPAQNSGGRAVAPPPRLPAQARRP